MAAHQNGSAAVAVSIVFNVFALIAVVLRIRARLLKKAGFQFNDYAIFVALLFSICFGVIVAIAPSWAYMGYHMQDVPPTKLSRIFLLFTIAEPMWGAGNTAFKISTLHLHYTIFSRSATFRRACYATIAVALANFIAILLETFVLCTPVQYNWDKTIKGGCTGGLKTAYLVASTTNMVLDLAIVALPMPMLWQLRLPWEKKIVVVMMFALGAVICIVSLLRVIVFSRLDLLDFWYAAYDIGVWSALEPALGIVGASLPVLRPVFSEVARSKIGQSVQSIFRSAGGTSTGQTTKRNSSDPKSWVRLHEGNNTPPKLGPIDQPYALDTLHDDRSKNHDEWDP